MITIKIEHIGQVKAKELYNLLANSEFTRDMMFELNYHKLSNVEVTGTPELLKILSEYYNV